MGVRRHQCWCWCWWCVHCSSCLEKAGARVHAVVSTSAAHPPASSPANHPPPPLTHPSPTPCTPPRIATAGLRIKETKEVYEGEVTELTPVETEHPGGGYGKVVSHVVIGLKTVRGAKQLKLDPTIYDSLLVGVGVGGGLWYGWGWGVWRDVCVWWWMMGGAWGVEAEGLACSGRYRWWRGRQQRRTGSSPSISHAVAMHPPSLPALLLAIASLVPPPNLPPHTFCCACGGAAEGARVLRRRDLH